MGDDNLTSEIKANKLCNNGQLAIADMQEIVTAINHKNGWFEADRTFGEDIALLHSEVSEALEAYRDHGVEDATLSECKYWSKPHSRHVSQAPDHICKPEGVGSEFADILVRLLDSCERYEIDLVTEFWRKVEYNATRGHRHGGRNL